MIRQDKQGKPYYDATEAMQRLNIKSRQTLQGLVRRHQIARFKFYPDRKVYYKGEDIDYLTKEEAEDPYELPPLTKVGYHPERGSIENVIREDERPTSKLQAVRM